MRIKRITAAILSLTLSLTMLAGCASSSKENEAQNSAAQAAYDSAIAAAEEEEAKTDTVVDEPDFLAFLTGESDVNFYDMSFEELSEATGGQLNTENATEYNESSGTARYSLGKKDSILGGRLSLPRECEVYCTLGFKDNKLKEMHIKVEGFTEEEATKLCDDFLAALDGKLPEGYEQFAPVGPMSGSSCEIGYSKGVDDYIVSLKRQYFSGDYYIEFTLDVYSERYGME